MSIDVDQPQGASPGSKLVPAQTGAALRLINIHNMRLNKRIDFL
jgi:hypothetical protein